MNETTVKYLIIGAGISGLSFADKISEDYLIIEKENVIGGYCKTIKKGDFIWDYAGHFYHFKEEKLMNDFLNSVGEENIIKQQKDTKILYNGSKIHYPFQSNIHELEKEEFIDCLYDLYNKEEKENYDNFLDMLYGKFGKSIVEKFLKPYNEKLYACDLCTLDKDAMGRFFPYAKFEDVINNMKENKDSSYNNQFMYPKQGAQCFINHIHSRLQPEKIWLDEEIIEINIDKQFVITNKNKKINYKYLINTSPLNQFLKLFKNESYNNLANNLSYNKVLVFNLGFKKGSNHKEHWMYIPDRNINFYRVGFYNNILQTSKLSMYIEIGFDKNDNIDIEEQLALTLENLQKLGITVDNELEEYNYVIMNPAYVHINNQHMEQIKELFKDFENKNIYSIGRYGAWKYCSMEDCILDATNLSEKIGGNKNED